MSAVIFHFPTFLFFVGRPMSFVVELCCLRLRKGGNAGLGFGFGFGYLVCRAPKLGHRTDGLWCVNNLPKVVT